MLLRAISGLILPTKGYVSVNGEIIGEGTPGAVAGRAENSIIESCETNVTMDGKALVDAIGTTDRMYESGDQGEEPAA